MSELGQVSWELHCDDLDPRPPHVGSVRLEEALNEPYEIRLSVSSKDPALDVPDLLGKDVVLRMERQPLERRFCGVIQEVMIHEATELGFEVTFSLRVRPALWMLSLRRDSRIFQKMSVPEIAKNVLESGLGPYGREVKDELTEEYPIREYCVQYQESDLAFVERLLEEEGISYAFDHDGDRETMVLRDRNESFSKVKTLPVEGVLQYRADASNAFRLESVFHLELARQNTVTSVAVRDSSFTREDLFFEDAEGGEDRRGRSRESYEHGSGASLTIYDYDEGLRRYKRHDAARQKQIRHQLHVVEAVHAYMAASDAIGVAPGTTFELSQHPTEGNQGEYLVTRVIHGTSGGGYENSFFCIPATTVYRPARTTKKPRIPSIQTAIVTGPAGEEIHVDEYGRIKVQFYWDRKGKLDEKSSCWVRTQQTWAGNGFGTWWVPRIGMEVIVQFVDGDPDRPLVTGCVYNADNALPYALPDEKTKSTIKSNSTLGGDGFNEFRFEDKKGQEEIWLHAQKDLNEKVLNSHTLNVGNCETIEIGVDQTQTIGNNQVEHVKANQTMTVDVNRVVTVGGNFEETITGNETRVVSGAVQEIITSGETRTVNAGRTTTINAGETKTVNGGKTESVSGGAGLTISGGSKVTVSGGSVEAVMGGKALNVIGELKEVVSTAIKLITPEFKRADPNNETFAATVKRLLGLSYEAVTVKNEMVGLERKIVGMADEKAGVKSSTFAVSMEAGGARMGMYGFSDDVAGCDLEKVGIKITM